MSDSKFGPPVEMGCLVPREVETVERSESLVGWTVEVEDGAPVLLDEGPVGEERRPALRREDLYPGRAVLAPTLFGYCRAVVSEGMSAETEGSIYFLRFDERRGWVCSSGVSKRALEAVAGMELK